MANGICGRKRVEIAIGKTYGYLTCLSIDAGKSAQGHVIGLYKCRCGNTVKKINAYVVSKHVSSCGCIGYSNLLASNITHGLSKNRSYTVWAQMMSRCHNKNNKRYRDYGGRGIKVCKRWHMVENFIADMGERPIGLQIDRINNNLGYSPSNCRWASRTEQQQNMRSNRAIKAFGKTMLLCEWARETGINADAIAKRINRGWSANRALSKPSQRSNIWLR